MLTIFAFFWCCCVVFLGLIQFEDIVEASLDRAEDFTILCWQEATACAALASAPFRSPIPMPVPVMARWEDDPSEAVTEEIPRPAPKLLRVRNSHDEFVEMYVVLPDWDFSHEKLLNIR